MKQKKSDKSLERLGKILLKPAILQKEFPSFNAYGSAPIEEYDKLMFFDKEKEKEWENLDDSTKKFCLDHLKETCSKMQNKLAIELLCHVINDMSERIKKLEEIK